MKEKRNHHPERKMKPVFLVFCEGETEEAYIHFLRQQYRLPIKVISHITGQNISPIIIGKQVKMVRLDKNDIITTFLMYDLDVNDILTKLNACKGSVNISSNPCIELWFLLHNVDQFADISTDACISKLQKISDWESYKKGMFSGKQKQILWEKRIDASQRARKLQKLSNPSSTVYWLIDAMEEEKRCFVMTAL